MKFFELFSDAKNRPAIELVLGVVFSALNLAYAFGAFGKPDNAIVTTVFLFAGALFGLNTAGNIFDQKE